MSGVEIVHNSPQTIWCPVDAALTIYDGSIVGYDSSGLNAGVTVWDEADGASNTSNLDIPFGIVLGNNLRTPLYSSTYKANYITAAATTAVDTDTTEYVLKEGPWAMGDTIAMVEVALITPHTILRAPIFNDAVGTAPSLLTATAGSGTGQGVTTNACDFTPVDSLATIYCRSGLNAGAYRITSDASTLTCTWTYQMKNITAANETFVRVPVRHGISYVRFGTDDVYNGYINAAATPASNYNIIHVVRLDLSVAGQEYCEFMFDSDNFCTARA